MNDRPYQTKAVEQLNADALEHRRLGMFWATGLGKTHTAVRWSQRRTVLGRVMFAAHTDELVWQPKAAYERLTGELVDVEKAEYRAQTGALWQAPYVVTSIQTQTSGRNGNRRFERFPPDTFGTVIIDEAHRAVNKSYRAFSRHYQQNKNLRTLYMTGTPNRADEQDILKLIDKVSSEYSLEDAIDDGWLVDVKALEIYVKEIDFDRVHTTQRDLSARELEIMMTEDRPLYGMVSEIFKATRNGQKTLVFTAGVRQSKAMCDILNSSEYKPGSAAHIDGKTPKDERAEILRRYRNRDIQYLCNCAVFGEGFDEPGIEVVVPRPTKSLPAYLQQLGRGTRPLPGVVDGLANATERKAAIAKSAKPYVRVFDFFGQSTRHNIVNATHALGGRYSDDVITLATTRLRDNRDADDVRAALEAAKAEVLERYRERLERERIEAEKRDGIIARVKATYGDERSIFAKCAEAAVHYTKPWRMGLSVTTGQKKKLTSMGFNADEVARVLNRGQVSAMIADYEKKQKPSVRMVGWLKWKGLYRPDITHAEAMRLRAAYAAGKPIPRKAEWARPTGDMKGPVG